MTNSINKKALLAIVVAGGLLNQATPVLSRDPNQLSDSVINTIATDSKVSPETKAFTLIKIAEAYIARGTAADAEAQYGNASALQSADFMIHRRDGAVLSSWADQIAHEGQTQLQGDKKSKALANELLKKALPLLDKITEPYAKLNLYFIASHLSKKLGNNDSAQRCDSVLDEAFKNCATSTLINENEAKAAISILVSMSYAYIPLRIGDYYKPIRNPKIQTYLTDENTAKSETLQLRAIAIADRLPETTDTRRKAHRNLALWYSEVGKTELAKKEKEALFKLVGINDDRILYPKSGDCGHLVWWTLKQPVSNIDCGMG